MAISWFPLSWYVALSFYSRTVWKQLNCASLLHLPLRIQNNWSRKYRRNRTWRFCDSLHGLNSHVVERRSWWNEDEEETRRLVLKEAKLFNSLTHPNIVKFKGICNDHYALLLEYMFFDFKPFDLDLNVNCLSELLSHFDKTDWQNISKVVFYQAASDVASGLQWVLTPERSPKTLVSPKILVSNQHVVFYAIIRLRLTN